MSLELESLQREYAPGEPVPLWGYVASMAVFSAGLGLALVYMARRKAPLPSVLDVVLLGTATHKLSRIVSKDFVMAPIRAPFARRVGAEGAGEVHDEARGSAARRTVGHLLTCPYCLGPWFATGLGTSMAMWPYQAGFVARVLTAVTLSDFLHMGYARLNESRRLVAGQRKRSDAEVPPSVI